MVDVRLSASARRDLARIDQFSAAEFGDDVADDYIRGLKTTFNLLQRHPEAGPVRPEYGKGIRCKVHRSHRIIYRIEGATVFVQRILHHSQQIRKHLYDR